MEALFAPINVSSLHLQQDFVFQRSVDTETLAIGAKQRFVANTPSNGFDGLARFLKNVDSRVFGHISYEMKDDVEVLASDGNDRIGFPCINFFLPNSVFERRAGQQWMAQVGEAELPAGFEKDAHIDSFQLPALEVSDSKDEYLKSLHWIQEHLQQGNVYELNYCVERFGNGEIDPFALFNFLDAHIQAPHAAFYRCGDRFAICMSPERFIKVENGSILTRPMKGTRPRYANKDEDEAAKLELAADLKERAENIMAVDVARHDLSRVAKQSSVRVDGLCEIKTFRNVHQMVSTVRAELRDELDHVALLRASFPMASMTGAPKIRAMKIIEELEAMKRGIYSGCIGSLDLRTHMDMNVVIRTIEYDSASKNISFKTGGAITAMSDPDSEYEEMMLKAVSVLRPLDHA